jgi:hypothetical protein
MGRRLPVARGDPALRDSKEANPKVRLSTTLMEFY